MGGNLFGDTCSPIKKEHIKPTLEKYFDELKIIFPLAADIFTFENFHYVGSTGKKDISGDIDLAIDKTLIVDNLKKFQLSDMVFLDAKTFYNRAKTSNAYQCLDRAINTHIAEKINLKGDLNILTRPAKSTSGNIFTLFNQYDENGVKLADKFVQIDLMIGDLDWLKFAYYSTSYDGNISGLHRTQLIVALFANKGYTFSHINGVRNKKTGKVEASSPQEAEKLLSKLYDVVFLAGDLCNYWYIWQLINLSQYSMTSQFESIINIYFKILDSTRCDIPYNLQALWISKKEELGLTGKFLPADSALIPYTTINSLEEI